jgi:hypothetical protein
MWSLVSGLNKKEGKGAFKNNFLDGILSYIIKVY